MCAFIMTLAGKRYCTYRGNEESVRKGILTKVLVVWVKEIHKGGDKEW